MAASRLTSVQFPLRVYASGESVTVVDRIGTVLSRCYFEDEPERRKNLRRLTKPEAIEAGKVIARALTAEFGPTS